MQFRLLHVGGGARRPEVQPNRRDGWQWSYEQRQGDVVGEILAAARERRADLIVLTTRGRHGFLDALRGSTTERLLARADCPLLAVPVR
jgi:nucleotide-binding universal stress UspA family protein